MLIDTFAEYVAQEMQRPADREALHHAKRAVVDWFAALFPGTVDPLADSLLAAHRRELGLGPASLPGFSTTALPATAAWINGSISHVAEFDDIFRDAIYHPGCPTVAAALAVAEDLGCSGAKFLQAVVAGYEVSTRVGVAIQPSHYRHFHTTGTVGCIGGATAASALLSRGRPDIVKHAIGTSASLAAGLQQAFRSDAMTKALHAGHAAWVGVTSASGAAHGVTAAADILEGSAGFGAALCDGADWSKATAALGTRYNITQVTQKSHGCCGHAFAAIDAALEIRRSRSPRADDVAGIDVSTYQTALDVTGNHDPKTPFEAKFSLPYVVAHALLHGSVRIDAFGADRLADRELRSVMQRVSLSADPGMSARFPHARGARVVVRFADGSTDEHLSPHRKGDPEAPLTDEELSDKFRELADPVVGADQARALLEQLWTLDRRMVRDLRLAGLRRR